MEKHYAEIISITERFLKETTAGVRQKGKILKKLVRQKNRATRKLAAWPRITKALIITLVVIGFFSGTLVAIEEVLRRHGPTVTLWGTLCATAIYIVCGIVMASLFGLVAIGWSGQMESSLEKKEARLKTEIKNLGEEIETLKEKARDLSEEAVHGRYQMTLHS